MTPAKKPVTSELQPSDYLELTGELPPYELPDIDAEAARARGHEAVNSIQLVRYDTYQARNILPTY